MKKVNGGLFEVLGNLGVVLFVASVSLLMATTQFSSSGIRSYLFEGDRYILMGTALIGLAAGLMAVNSDEDRKAFDKTHKLTTMGRISKTVTYLMLYSWGSLCASIVVKIDLSAGLRSFEIISFSERAEVYAFMLVLFFVLRLIVTPVSFRCYTENEDADASVQALNGVCATN